MHIIIYGPEGSGKGTQAKLLSRELKLPVYTSGDLVRNAAVNDKGLIGKACRHALKEGRYVPDSEMFVLWKNKLRSDEGKRGFILDGFPRNIRQAKFLLRKIEKYGYKLNKVIYLNLSDEEAIKRLSKRARKLYKGSSDNHDDPKLIKQRLKIYRDQEAEVLDFFRKRNLILEINAEQEVSDVFQNIVKGLDLV